MFFFLLLSLSAQALDVTWDPALTARIPRKTLERLDWTLKSLDGYFGREFDLPQSVKMIPNRPSEGVEARFYFPGQSEIHLNYPYGYSGWDVSKFYRGTDNQMVAVLAHEFGHLAFDRAIERAAAKLPRLKARYADFKRIGGPLRQQRNELREQIERITAAAQKTKTEPDAKAIAAVQAKLDALQAQIEQLEGGFDLGEFFLAYHETFADLSACVFSNDGKAMYKTMFFEGYVPDPKAMFAPSPREYRDYTRVYAVKGWTVDNSHELFVPAAGHIWRKYLTGSVGSRRRALTILVDVMATDLDARLADPKLRDLSPEALNRRLIERVDTAFGGAARP